MAVYTSVAQLVGNTPLLELANYGKLQGLKAKILVKLEYSTPQARSRTGWQKQ